VKTLFENVGTVCNALREAYGDLALAALLMPEEAAGRWDFVVAATWLKGTLADYELVARKLSRFLRPDELSQISRTVIIPSDEPRSFVGLGTTLRLGEMRNFTFNGEPIREAYIFASRTSAGKTTAARKSPKRRAIPSPTHSRHGKRRLIEQPQQKSIG
jgi:hypothetical protein